MRTVLTIIAVVICTIVLATLVLLAAVIGIPYRPGGIYELAPRWWARALLFTAGVRIRLHDAERIRSGDARVYVCNHVSWFNVLALAVVLPRYKFIGKAELTRVPLFGPAAVATGLIPIERDNRKSAFGSYHIAARQIRDGVSVIVFPEGTRGTRYALRPFKKGPFVLAIEAGVPIIPTVLHGTIEILPRGSLHVRPGSIDIHFLQPIPTVGLTYDDRDALAQLVWERMAEAMEEQYGVPRVEQVAA